MVRNELYVEELLCNDAAKISIDQEFKNDLKSRLIFGDEYKDIIKPTKHKNNFKQNRYFKIASGFVICVFVSGAILKTIDIQNKGVVANNEGKTDVSMSITGQKDPSTTNGKKQSLLEPNKAVVSKDKTNQQFIAPKASESIIANGVMAKNNDDNKEAVNEGVSNGNSAETDYEINQNIVNHGKYGSVSTDLKGPIEVPKMGVEKEDTLEVLKSYDSRYSFDEKRLVSVKSGGIYVQDLATSNEKKLVAYNEKTHIINKPNLTLEDGIIYYKAEKVTLDNGTSGEINGAIYLTNSSGKETTKIVDGKNPMVSKDGKKVVYEFEGKIYVLTLDSKDRMFVDNGNYPAFAVNGNLISYVKEEKEPQNYDSSNKKDTASAEKRFSSLWMFDLTKSMARKLTNKVDNIENSSLESWAQVVRNESIQSDVDMRYSYYESIWSTNNKEVYVLKGDNKAQVFELIKFNLDN